MAHKIGIDLGTTNSAVAFTENGRQRCVKIETNEHAAAVFPSCVGLDRSDRVVYGSKAYRIRDAERRVREFKRHMGSDHAYKLGDQTYSPTELSALVLAEIKAGFERQHGPIDGAVITVPANYGDRQRAAVLEAGKLAGLKVLRLINEPSAAAIAYSLSDQPPKENSIVIDWGGGTLDVSLVDCIDSVLDIKANDGDPYCGGKDVDAALLALITRKMASTLGEKSKDPHVQAELTQKCEAIKIHLSQNDIWDEPIDLQTTKSFLEIEITRAELEAAAMPLVDRVLAAVQRTLDKCPEGKLTPSQVTDVILVGGSCYMPLLQRRVEQFFGRKGRISLNPMEVVALGAAYQAEHAEKTGSLVTIHSLATSLGTACLGRDSKRILRDNLYSEILPATSKLPARGSNEYFTVQDDQPSIVIDVFENPDGRETVEGLEPWCSRELKLPPAPASSFPIEIIFDYAVDQRLKVQVRIPHIGKVETWEADHTIKIRAGHAAAQEKVDTLRNSSLEALGNYVASVRSKLNGNATEQLVGLLRILEEAINSGDLDRARAAKSKLGAALFDAGIRLN